MKMLDVQWQDHIHTRYQTWKALEISAILTIALIGSVWQLDNPIVTIGAGLLLAYISISGCQITLWHRKVEQTKFRKIGEAEEALGIADPQFKPPQDISLVSIIKLNQSSTPLFILRMHFVILLFAFGHVAWGVVGLLD